LLMQFDRPSTERGVGSALDSRQPEEEYTSIKTAWQGGCTYT